MRKVPCTQLVTEKSPARVRSRNRMTSSPGWKRGAPSTKDCKWPTRPPGSRTVIRRGAAPFIVWMKGAAPRLITVRLPGGRVGHLQSFVDGAPRFQPGEEVILFLERTRAGDFSVTSWVQGTFRIHRDASTGRGSVTQDSSGFAVFDPATRKFRSAGVRNLPLEQFKQRVAEAVERRASGRQR